MLSRAVKYTWLALLWAQHYLPLAGHAVSALACLSKTGGEFVSGWQPSKKQHDHYNPHHSGWTDFVITTDRTTENPQSSHELCVNGRNT